MRFVLFLLTLGLLAEEAKQLDPVKELMSKFLSARATIAQVDSQIKLKALELQSLNIQQRDLQLSNKEIELKLQSLMCEKGEVLTITDTARCKKEK